MSDKEALLKAVIDFPNNDEPRLLLADKIQDEGDEELAAFIRGPVAVCYCVQFDEERQVHTHQAGCYRCGGCGFVRRCQHEGCRLPAILCSLESMTDGEQIEAGAELEEWFCGEHASQHGYCRSCGSFWGGIDSSEDSGLCDHCRDQLDADCQEEREWEDSYYDDDDFLI